MHDNWSFPGSLAEGFWVVNVQRELSGSGTGCSLGEQGEESAATWPERRRSLCSAEDRGRHWAADMLLFPLSLKEPECVNYSQLWRMFTCKCTVKWKAVLRVPMMSTKCSWRASLRAFRVVLSGSPEAVSSFTFCLTSWDRDSQSFPYSSVVTTKGLRVAERNEFSITIHSFKQKKRLLGDLL